ISAGEQLLASVDRETVTTAMDMPAVDEIGSNAYAVGADASQTNSGILFGNPHFPWQGYERFFMFHLTLPGEYDVMGSALIGLPAPVIGFSQNVAWSHTVSTGSRFTFYELELNPDNKMQYIYDGEVRDIESRTVSAQNLLADGSVETVEHT
ncbi:MAG: penicillin acylase family protein, partial [Halieaceae bacterium]|nr:penicillin acylase family protein [Halieaceae bacterium]